MIFLNQLRLLKILSTALLLLVWSNSCLLYGQVSPRETILINSGWKYAQGDVHAARYNNFNDTAWENIGLPHSFSIPYFMSKDFYVGYGWYRKHLSLTPEDLEKKLFLEFEGVFQEAEIFVNGKLAGSHTGGYTGFSVDISSYVRKGDNLIAIRVNNLWRPDVAPRAGEHVFSGGIYRNVHLVKTKHCHIAWYGTFITTPDLEENNGQSTRIKIETEIINECRESGIYRLLTHILDRNGNRVAEVETTDTIAAGSDRKFVQFTSPVYQPDLWSPQHPSLYRTVSMVYHNGELTDSIQTSFGFRWFKWTADKGFFLNGRPYRLNGVNRHQDRAERASAFYEQDHDEDLDLIEEMGCNAVRLSHYPQAKYLHSQMDRRGLVAWAEIPFVNVYVNNPAYDENLTRQLTELILQNYNHPSILFWGLFNEINSGWLDRPSDMVVRLDSLAHRLDPSRPTMGAFNQNDDFNGFTDLIAFNKYFGWYGSDMSEMGQWIDREHAAHPERKMGISEYGAGACIYQQAEELKQPEPWGQWHPENWQTYYHIENWKQLQERPFLWCNFIWCMFDFSAAGRREGTVMGRNDKGLVTYDRKEKKDAFYFYKANWNKKEPFVHIAGKRLSVRQTAEITVMAFSNSGAAELWVNGQNMGQAQPDEVNVLRWENIRLKLGHNELVVKNKHCSDRCVWQLR